MFLRLLTTMILSASFCHALPGDKTPEKRKPSREGSIYYFEHKLLPKWTHNSQGGFFNDLKVGIPPKMLRAATEIVDGRFANALKVIPYPQYNAYDITFEKPSKVPQCYHAIIVKHGNEFAYYTLEKTFDFEKTDTARTVVGMWEKDGKHLNLGGRSYTDLKSFTDELFPDAKVK